MKPGTAVTMMIPPFSRRRRSTASGTLRAWPLIARAEEWLKITGARLTSSASIIVFSDTWLRSTTIPIRFISRTRSLPKSVSPPCSGSSVALSAHGVLRLCVSVM